MFGAAAVATLTVFRADSEWWEPVVAIVLFALNVFVLVRTLVASATVCEAGLRYQTLRGKGEMLWEDVEKFRYSILTTYHQGFIKTTQYTMILVDKDGHRAELGSNVEQPDELAALLCNKLQAPLLRKVTADYDAGKTLDLGAVKLSHQGIQMSLGLLKATILLANVAGCSIDQGTLNIGEWVNGKIKHRAVMLRSVDNAFALVELINSKIARRALGASTGQ